MNVDAAIQGAGLQALPHRKEGACRCAGPEGVFSARLEQAIERRFAAADADQDGVLSWKEVQSAVEHHGSPKELAAKFRHLAGTDGTISLEEAQRAGKQFLQMWRHAPSLPPVPLTLPILPAPPEETGIG